MTRAIRKHLGDFIALAALFAIGIGVSGYILAQQRLRFPFVEEDPFPLKMELQNAQAVVPGQGQTVRVAGVRVGDIGDVEVKNGKALVTMNLDPEYKDLVHRDATALLRSKTGLKDMFVELDPGTKNAALFKKNGLIPIKNGLPDVNQDEILAALDSDTRAYLQLLLNGLGKGLKGRSADLREVFRRLEPLHRDLARVQTAIAERRHNLRRLVHNYGSLINELADHDQDLSRLVVASNQVLEAFASQAGNISLAVSKLPSTLRTTEGALVKVNALGRELGPSLEALRPAFRQLDTTNRQVLPLAREGTPILRDQIRPFVRLARPYVRNLRPAAENLAAAQPDFTRTLKSFNRLVNMLAYNHPVADEHNYLFWLAWVAQDTVSLFSTGDASGPFRRALFSLSCQELKAALANQPELAVGFGITYAALQATGACP